MITYSVKPATVEGEEDKVVKTGHPYEFTMTQVRENMTAIAKSIKELTAKLTYEKAKLTNIEQFHPEVLELGPETLAACKLYLDIKMVAEKVEAALNEMTMQYASNEAEIAEITLQTGKTLPVSDEAPAPEGTFVETAESAPVVEEQA